MDKTTLCMDGFCIGQNIGDARFDEVKWVLPKGLDIHNPCSKEWCRPASRLRGYNPEEQSSLANVTDSFFP
jgi:hypothetical protein